MENLVASFQPLVVKAGLPFVEILKPFDEQGVLLGDGVGGFFGSRGFVRPELEEDVRLVYVPLRNLGFKEPVLAELAVKKAQKTRKNFDVCPMELAMNLAGKMSEVEFDLESRTYYIVSDPQLDKTVRPDTPDFLKIGKTEQGKLLVSGWNRVDLIDPDDFLVFRDEPKKSKRSDLTKL